jgi:hypothetical protein
MRHVAHDKIVKYLEEFGRVGPLGQTSNRWKGEKDADLKLQVAAI